MLTQALLLSALALLPQDPAEPAPEASDRTGVLLLPELQAPSTRGRTRSRSTYRRSQRPVFRSIEGNTGRIMTPVQSLVSVRGMEDNVVVGIGIVTGLAGTGDTSDLAKQLLSNFFAEYGLPVDAAALASKNVAVVRVEAEIPAGMKPGQRIDVRCSTLGDSKSLLGGTLMPTELFDSYLNRVYATASGPLTVGGFTVEGDAASATKNHPTVATMPGGGKIEREVPTQAVSEQGFIYLDSKQGQDTFGNVVAVAERINALFPGMARVLGDGKTVQVGVPVDIPSESHVAYVASLMRLEVESENEARVVINERTGVLVLGGDVRLKPGAVMAGALVVTISENEQNSQPAPFSGGTTETESRTELDVTEEDSQVFIVPEATTLQEVVDVLNVLGATPRDTIQILNHMSRAGMLVADIERM